MRHHAIVLVIRTVTKYNQLMLNVQYYEICYVAHWRSARWAWSGYQPGLGSIPRPGRI